MGGSYIVTKGQQALGHGLGKAGGQILGSYPEEAAHEAAGAQPAAIVCFIDHRHEALLRLGAAAKMGLQRGDGEAAGDHLAARRKPHVS